MIDKTPTLAGIGCDVTVLHTKVTVLRTDIMLLQLLSTIVLHYRVMLHTCTHIQGNLISSFHNPHTVDTVLALSISSMLKIIKQ